MKMRHWAPAVLALALLTAACGQSASGNDGVATASGSDKSNQTGGDGGKDKDKDKKKDPQQAGLDFARCMREHGVDVPDPQTDGEGFVKIGPGPAGGASEGVPFTPPAGFEEAEKACRHHLEGLIQGGGGQMDPKEQDRALKFAQCMREHGVDMPDPDFSQGGVAIRIGGEGFDPNSQVFKDAQKACGSLFGPGEGSGPAPARGATS